MIAWLSYPPRLGVTILLALLLFLGRGSLAWAGPRDEVILAEKPIEEEAKAQDYRHLFRMLYFPSLPVKDYCFGVKVFLDEHRTLRGNRGFLVLKVGTSDGRIMERSRPLKEEEAQLIWETLSGEELFSLPAQQSAILDRPGFSIPGVMTPLVFSHFDKRAGTMEEIHREPQWSRPAARVQQMLADVVSDLVADIMAHEKGE